jgi:hypothetical protein
MTWGSVTLRLPKRTVMATIRGKWRRTPSGLEAMYTRDELSVCMWVTNVWAQHERGQVVRHWPGREEG